MSWPGPGEATIVLGHRGASRIEVENTLAAFKRALEEGADGVELDVRLSADGEVVVFHDDDLLRMAGREELIADLPYRDLAEVTLERGASIPTLSAVLREIPALINIEIKPPPHLRIAGWCRAVADVIEAARAWDRVLVTSFHPGVVAWFRLARRDAAVGLLCHAKQGRPLREAWLARPLRPFALHPEHSLVTAAKMREWQSRGLAIGTWTVDDPSEAARLARLGVGAIISNVPGAIAAAVRNSVR